MVLIHFLQNTYHYGIEELGGISNFYHKRHRVKLGTAGSFVLKVIIITDPYYFEFKLTQHYQHQFQILIG